MFDLIEREPRARARHRIHRHERRMWKAFVQVFHDHARVVQHEIAVDQGRRRVIRVQIEQVFGVFARGHIDDLDLDGFFRDDDPRPVTPWVIGRGKQRGNKK